MSFTLFSLLVICLASTAYAKVDPMHGVLGFSSGAYFAAQYQIAYSSVIRGAAIFAGGPYYCAQDSVLDALVDCMSNAFSINLANLESDARGFASNKQIDPLSNIANQNIFLYSGTLDFVVAQAVVMALQQMYTDLGATNISTEYAIQGTHGFPTTNFGASCASFGTPFIVNCGYDGAGAAVNKIWPGLKPIGQQVQRNLVTIDQSKFTPNGVSPSSISLDQTGFVYVPTRCSIKSQTCKLLVAFHGCEQYYQTVQDAFTRHTGLNDWAESNNIIVLYPQTISSTFDPTNSDGCYDWWGYNEPAYATNGGSQMTTVRNMVKFIVSNFTSVADFQRL